MMAASRTRLGKKLGNLRQKRTIFLSTRKKVPKGPGSQIFFFYPLASLGTVSLWTFLPPPPHPGVRMTRSIDGVMTTPGLLLSPPPSLLRLHTLSGRLSVFRPPL